jgi:fibroblast growth factor receptor 2/cadherin 2 type 1 (N-cadherin)
MTSRNVLVGSEGLNKVKLSDVGLSRTLTSSDYYRKVSSNKVPLKWMAPESILERLYTSASDVWSFGVLCWEIYALGDTPYKQFRTDEIVMTVLRGFRMPCPPLCHADVYVGVNCGPGSLSTVLK